jgi:hypothetical protein
MPAGNKPADLRGTHGFLRGIDGVLAQNAVAESDHGIRKALDVQAFRKDHAESAEVGDQDVGDLESVEELVSMQMVLLMNLKPKHLIR